MFSRRISDERNKSAQIEKPSLHVEHKKIGLQLEVWSLLLIGRDCETLKLVLPALHAMLGKCINMTEAQAILKRFLTDGGDGQLSLIDTDKLNNQQHLLLVTRIDFKLKFKF